MAARKSFLKTADVSAEFEQRLAAAAQMGVTDAQMAEQRVSFAYGNAPAKSKQDKDSVRADSKHNRLTYA